MNGFLLIDKSPGMTSFDVVARLRRLTGVRKIGHAGTLDPDATGLLILAIGRATRGLEFLGGWSKDYWCSGRLGASSTTDDAAGELTPTEGVEPLSRERFEQTLSRYRGDIEQVPPAFSAIKIRGERLYKAARRGEKVEAPPRPVTVHTLECVGYEWPDFELTMRVSGGTYVRSLARDVGRDLGQGAYTTAIRRTAIGPHSVDDATPLETLERTAGMAAERLLPIGAMLRHLPSVQVDEAGARRLHNGQFVRVDALAGGAAGDEKVEALLILNDAGEALAIGRAEACADGREWLVKPRKALLPRDGV
ncbi:tRNA pseudouridine(55) synthase TruB [Candidatus Sumerlaeota bacterium]